MKPAVPQETIDVHDLRVGMHVHLDVGWLSHPFPLSSFRIENDAQIRTIRALGRRRVRWSPALSSAGGAAGARLDARSADAGVDRSHPADTAEAAEAAEAADAVAPAGVAHAAAVAAVTPEQAARIAARRRLVAERAALAVAEQQFAEVGRDWRRATDLAATNPRDARRMAEALTQALIDKLLASADLHVRLLGEQSGERSAQHAVNVGVIALLLGRALGWPAAELLDLGTGALLHDIGKADLPERVRHRADHLAPAELRAYEDHVARGVALAVRMGLAQGATRVIAQHHECADGSGFPLRIAGERMSAAARIVALVNRYDRLINPPLGVRAATPHEALALLFAQQRAKFDAAILGAFIRMLGVYPPGSAVQLTDDRYALVVAVDPGRPLKPRVWVHDALRSPGEPLPVDLERHAALGIRRSLHPRELPDAALHVLAPRQRVGYFFEPAPDPEPLP